MRARYRVPPGTIRIAIPEDLVLFTATTALETVLKNLLDNAVKYSDEPIEVVITAWARAERVHIEVSDRGIGIPRAHLKRIFNRFYRVPHEKVNARRGTGLGLYVVGSLVRTLGGRLTAHSDGPGEGTVMRFDLPLGYEPAGEP